MEERQNNYTIWEGYELPSGGKIYEKQINPHIELRSMSARDEMKRLAPSSTPLKTLADIIDGCMIEKIGMSSYDMCMGDFEFLLHKLRIVTYGPDYKVSVTCPYCGETTDTIAKLDELQLLEFNQNKFEELRTFTLPIAKQLITLKIQSPRLLEEIEARAKELKRKAPTAEIDFDLLASLTYSIDFVDGKKLGPLDIEKFINNLTARDMQKILNNIEELKTAIGIDNQLLVKCTKCGEHIKTFFRFGPEFFRPTTI